MKHNEVTRRGFLRDTAIGSIAMLGWPGSLSWAIEPSGAAQPLKIVYYTDIHTRVEWDTPEAVMQAAAAMNAHKPDLVLCGGDMITDGYQSSAAQVAPRWDAYRKMHAAIQPEPVFILGNHDLVGVEPEDGTPPADDPRADVKKQMNMTDTYRSFDRNGYHFILLDSVQVTKDSGKYRGFIDETQMAWLKQDLAVTDHATPIVLMCHMPLLTGFFQMTGGVEAPVPPNRGVVNNLEVLSVFADHRLLLVLQGHLHVNEMMRWRDTTFITGGAVCGKWWRGEWHGTGEGYGVINLHPDRVDWEYHTYGWIARRPATA
jgi:3',5'-cyclic-AMP phosphodiesterase